MKLRTHSILGLTAHGLLTLPVEVVDERRPAFALIDDPVRPDMGRPARRRRKMRKRSGRK